MQCTMDHKHAGKMQLCDGTVITRFAGSSSHQLSEASRDGSDSLRLVRQQWLHNVCISTGQQLQPGGGEPQLGQDLQPRRSIISVQGEQAAQEAV
jgi:hypothetical protein